ncbi:hypothetical protein H696_06200, partial [Fonticula alba]
MYTTPSGDACLPCHATCAECSSHRSSACTACPGTHVLDRGHCREACPALGFFQEGNVCTPCHGSCLSCGGPGADQCQLCPRSHIFHRDQCLADCPPSSTPLGGSCAECDDSCTACTGPNSNQCTACAPTAPQLWDGACLGDCPGGTFPETGSSMSLDTCLPCAPYCLECGGPAGAQCTRCIEGLVLHPVHGCVSSCGRGLVLMGNQCTACSPGCRHCEGSPEHCTQCPEGMLLGTAAGTCVPSCGQQEFADLATPSLARCVACHADCVSCERGSGSEHCTVCRPELAFLVGVGCVAACPEGHFKREGPLPGGHECARCADTCAACTGPEMAQCTRCVGDRLLMAEAGVCLPAGEDACPAGWHTDAAARRCLRCPEGCLSCDASVDDCEQCQLDRQLIRLLDRAPTEGTP